MKVYIWGPVKQGQTFGDGVWSQSAADNHFGHAAVELSDGFYISIWPQEVLGRDMVISPCKYVKMTDDLVGEERRPDVTYLLPFPPEVDAKAKEKFEKNKKKYYSLLSHNCCNVAVTYVKVGLKHCEETWNKEFKSFTPRKLNKRLNWEEDDGNELKQELKKMEAKLTRLNSNPEVFKKLKTVAKLPDDSAFKFRPWTPKTLNESLQKLKFINGKEVERFVRDGFTDITIGSSVMKDLQPTLFAEVVKACDEESRMAKVVMTLTNVPKAAAKFKEVGKMGRTRSEAESTETEKANGDRHPPLARFNGVDSEDGTASGLADITSSLAHTIVRSISETS